MADFPYGKAALALLVIALITGGVIAVAQVRTRAHQPDLVFATFSKEHAEAYGEAIADFEKRHGVRIQLQVVDQRALQGRLQSALQVGAEVPDMVELIDGSMGVFTKGPLKDVGFVDLTERVHQTGLFESLVTSRFGKWSSRGRIFALPHDVHPTMLAYRRDLIEQLGIDVNKLTTWEEFARVGREITRDLNGDKVTDRYMIDLPADGADALRLLILQNGGVIFDASGEVAFDSEATLEVVCWYVMQTQGTDRIAFPCGWGQNLAKSMIDGLVLFYLCPDWRTMQFQMDIPSLNGKLGLIPLPAWKAGGIRTSSWGGTGLAFTRSCRNFELAWQLAMHLYYDKEQLGPRFAATNILPPLKDAWTQPQFNTPSQFYGGIPIGSVYAGLADQVPEETCNAYTVIASGKLSEAFTNASLYYADKNNPPGNLREYARAELKRCADRVRVIMHRNAFLKTTPVPEPAR